MTEQEPATEETKLTFMAGVGKAVVAVVIEGPVLLRAAIGDIADRIIGDRPADSSMPESFGIGGAQKPPYTSPWHQ